MNSNFDIKQNFWKLHPVLTSIEPFKKFYSTNVTKDSSILMWFIKYGYHPDSEFFNMSVKDKNRILGRDIIGEESYYEDNKDDVDYLVDAFCKIIEHPIDRTIRIVKEKLDQKNDFLSTNTYDMETFEDIDKALLSLDKQVAMLEKLENNREKKKSSNIAKGDVELSESDQGII